MKRFIWILGAMLLIPGVVYAQTPQAGATAAATSKIVIKTQPLRGNTIDVQLNGRRIATMEGDQTHTGVFAPGKMRITVPGDKPESSVAFEAEANKEYLFEVALVPSSSGFFLFGIVGSSAMATYEIALKETRLVAITPAPPVAPAGTRTDQAAGQGREDEQQRARQEQDRKQAEEAQRRARAEEEAKRADLAKGVAKAEVSAAPRVSIDFTAEAKKSSKILGCNSEDVRVVGVDGQNILFSTSCQNGQNIILSCDPSGLCLRK